MANQNATEEEEHRDVIRYHESHKKGCVLKPCGRAEHDYRKNGYEYASKNYTSYYNLDFATQGTPERKRINHKFPPPKYARGARGWDPRYSPDTWFIGTTKPFNWLKGDHPFDNQAHHVMPGGVLMRTFGTEELCDLQDTGYNINEGKNILILPSDPTYAYVMGMHTHVSSHKPYSDDVEGLVNELKSKYTKGRANPEGHRPVDKKNMPNIKRDLEQWTTDEVGEIMISGREPGKEGTNMSEASVFQYMGRG